MNALLPALALAGLLAPAGAPAPEAEPDPQAAYGRRAPAKRPAEPEASSDVILRAEFQEQVEKGHMRARGFVDVRVGEMRLQADRLDYFQAEQADGTESRRIVAEGNVVFMRGDERLSGTRAELDLDTGHGFFENAVGFVEPGVWVEARRIERLDDRTYRAEGGTFTSCSQPNPRWKFQAASATIHVNDKIVASHALFTVKGVPAFYLPYIYYPIREDQRSTGFLLPHIGYSDYRGFNIGSGFFWAMSRSVDQTFYADYYSKFGYGLGHEFRFAADQPNRGVFRTYFFKPQSGGSWDYDLDYTALVMLPGRVQTSLAVRQYSNVTFQQQFQDNFNLATTRTSRASLSFQRSFGATSAQALLDSYDTFFGGEIIRTNRHLPSASVRRPPLRIGRSGIVFGYEARFDELSFGVEAQTATGTEQQISTYYRLDLGPEISRPFSTSFLQLTPRAAFRYTRYGNSAVLGPFGLTEIIGPPLDRPFFEGSVDMRGPTFSRVFGSGNSKVKHIIGPEMFWTYRTAISDFDEIPKFDGYDYFLGTNQVTYSLVQRLLARRPGPGGRPVAYEFLSWRLSQTYYVQINQSQNNFDPNYSSSSYGPGGKAEHLSPILSRFRLRPTPHMTADFNVEYDVNFKQLRTLGVYATYNAERGSLLAGYSKVLPLNELPVATVPLSHNLRAGGSYQLLPKRLVLEAGADYDLLTKKFLSTRGQLRYDVQCCGLLVQFLQYNYNERVENQWRFAITLANVGTIGNFMGLDANRLNLGSYR